MPLKAFQLLAGAHVGPDYTADPVEVDSPTPSQPDRVLLQFPPRQFVARTTGSLVPPGQTNVVYSPSDLSVKFNHPRSEKFRALGDPPRDVLRKFEDAVGTGNLDPRQSGEVPKGRVRRQSLIAGAAVSTMSTTSEVGPDKDKARRAAEERKAAGEEDPHDLSAADDSTLDEMTKDELRECAEDEGAEVNSRMTKDELAEAIRTNRKGKK